MFRPYLSQRILKTETSRTVRFTALIAEMKKQGRRVINFAVGEPDFPTPEPILDAVREALVRGETRYGPVGGLPILKEALAGPYPGWGPDNIVITNGSKQALYSLFQVLCDPGDDIIIPTPCWVSFIQQVILAGGRPVLVPTVNDQLDLNAIERAIGPNTAALLINSPNNPTGAVYPKDALENAADLVRKHDIYLISDEAYDAFVYDGAEGESLFAQTNVRDRLIVCKSFSKTYAMTGFRVGYMAGPASVAEAVATLQSHLTGNVCTFAQYGALAALTLDASVTASWRQVLREKRDLAHAAVSKVFSCRLPQGAFYLFPDISARLSSGQNAEIFSEYLLQKAGVAVVPGEAFGAPGHIRISYAVPQAELLEGLERMEQAL